MQFFHYLQIEMIVPLWSLNIKINCVLILIRLVFYITDLDVSFIIIIYVSHLKSKVKKIYVSRNCKNVN